MLKSTIKSDHDSYGKINTFSVKSTILLKNWFDVKILSMIAFYSTFPLCAPIHSVVKLKNSLVKMVLSRNFCQKSMRLNFRSYHTTLCNLKFFERKIREINFLLYVKWFHEIFKWKLILRFSTVVVFTKYLSKENFLFFSTQNLYKCTYVY